MRQHTINLPSAFQGDLVPDQRMHLNILKLDKGSVNDFLTVGFLSFAPLSDDVGLFELDIGFKPHRVFSFSHPETLTLTEKSINLFKNFHHEFFKCVLRSKFSLEDEFATVVVPLVYNSSFKVEYDLDAAAESLIDWDALDFCIDSEKRKARFEDPYLDVNYVKDIVLFDPYRYKRNFLISSFLPDVKPYTPYENGTSITGAFEDLASFYKIRLEYPGDFDPEQFLIKAKPIGYPYLNRRMVADLPEEILIPEATIISPIRRGHIESALVFPVIFHNLMHRMLMQDLIDGHLYPSHPFNCSVDILSEAFTAPSSALLPNYERLETLGDSFLKIQLTLHLFVQHPSRHEGFLTQARMHFENNKFLREVANNRKIESLILSRGFARHSFCPPIQGKLVQHKLSDKTVADVVESTIGACLMHSGPNTASNSISFFLGSEFKAWDHYAIEWAKVLFPIKPIEPSILRSCAIVSSRIKYTFKNVTLLVEALTHSSAISGGASYERLEFLGMHMITLLIYRGCSSRIYRNQIYI